ncbi:MAG: 4-diphosphocytidyl-2-C-methyl-D-erythritol kinase [Hyphomicrobiaceae bacterium hypho_1]
MLWFAKLFSIMTPKYTEKAYAKVNLFLRIIGHRPDNYHELISLVAFASDVYDIVTLTPSADFSFRTSGSYSSEVIGKNIICKSVELAKSKIPDLKLGRIELEKKIPVSSGLGGGSADAAAVLRTIGHLNNVADLKSAFFEICSQIGADVPVCLNSQLAKSAFMWGRGEHIWRPTSSRNNILPEGVYAILVNPGIPVSTKSVFSVLRHSNLQKVIISHDIPSHFKNFDELIKYLHNTSNDLEEPACSIAPIISDVLCVLRNLPKCALARMSGSGATCFALFDNLMQTKMVAKQLSYQHPEWWIKSTQLS